MAKIAFYVDVVEHRNFSIEAVELLSAPFESSSIYCLNYGANVLGPIAKRTIIAAGRFVEDLSFYCKLPFLAGGLNLPKESHSVVTLSQGMLPLTEKSKLYYFFSPYWEKEDFKILYQQQNWLIKKWLDNYQKRVLLSFQKNQERLILANKTLAKNYGLDKAKIIYPFFKSEDFPKIDLITNKQAVTIYLKGANAKEKLELVQGIKSCLKECNFFVFSEENDRALFESMSNVRFESQFCSATLQAAFLQSMFFFQFSHAEELSYALGALASGTYVAYIASTLLPEVIPSGLLLPCYSVNDLFSMIYQWGQNSWLVSQDEARRFALRFSERHFKEKIIGLMNQIAYK